MWIMLAKRVKIWKVLLLEVWILTKLCLWMASYHLRKMVRSSYLGFAFVWYNYLTYVIVVYFDQCRHACACVRMVENNPKHLFFFVFLHFSDLFWASGVHDEKGTFLLIFKCFRLFLTMRLLVEIHNMWLCTLYSCYCKKRKYQVTHKKNIFLKI